MQKHLKDKKTIPNQILLLCLVLGIILLFNFISEFSSFYIAFATMDNLDENITTWFLPYVINLLVIFCLLRSWKIGWILLVLDSSIIFFSAISDYIKELQIPVNNDSNTLDNLLFILSEGGPRLGLIHYLTTVTLFGAILIYSCREKFRQLFSLNYWIMIMTLLAGLAITIVRWYKLPGIY